MLETPDGASRVELTKFQSPVGAGSSEVLPPNTIGIRHLAFVVTDVGDVVARLQARGVELVGQVEHLYRLCYVRGPEGIIVELAERLG